MEHIFRRRVGALVCRWAAHRHKRILPQSESAAGGAQVSFPAADGLGGAVPIPGVPINYTVSPVSVQCLTHTFSPLFTGPLGGEPE